jgi:anti-sigma-K factor RskA
MSIIELQKKLLAVARAHSPSDEVPYAFEKRILARITSQPMVDVWAVWSRLLWRAAAPCVGIMLVMSAWAAMSLDLNGNSEPLARDLEETVLAPLASMEDSW